MESNDADPPERFRRLVACLIPLDYVRSDDWVAWAADELARADGAPSWLAELTTTYDMSGALALLEGPPGIADVKDYLGCLWLSFLDCSLNEHELVEVGLEAAGGWDTGGGFVPFQQELMALMIRVDALHQGGRPRSDFKQLDNDVVQLFRPLGERVLQRVQGRLTMSGFTGARRSPPRYD